MEHICYTKHSTEGAVNTEAKQAKKEQDQQAVHNV